MRIDVDGKQESFFLKRHPVADVEDVIFDKHSVVITRYCCDLLERIVFEIDATEDTVGLVVAAKTVDIEFAGFFGAVQTVDT